MNPIQPQDPNPSPDYPDPIRRFLQAYGSSAPDPIPALEDRILLAIQSQSRLQAPRPQLKLWIPVVAAVFVAALGGEILRRQPALSAAEVQELELFMDETWAAVLTDQDTSWMSFL